MLTATPVVVKSTEVRVLLLALARVHVLPECELASVKTVRRYTSAKSTISLYISAAWQ